MYVPYLDQPVQLSHVDGAAPVGISGGEGHVQQPGGDAHQAQQEAELPRTGGNESGFEGLTKQPESDDRKKQKQAPSLFVYAASRPKRNEGTQ